MAWFDGMTMEEVHRQITLDPGPPGSVISVPDGYIRWSCRRIAERERLGRSISDIADRLDETAARLNNSDYSPAADRAVQKICDLVDELRKVCHPL